MPVLRIKTISVKGFRAFGAAEQTLFLPADITVVWGSNSKGKSSLAEAFEFLLTGRITRRELMSSTQDEFADALRNAHLADSDAVYVASQIKAADGIEHYIRRVLTGDYTKRQDCTSRLEIDGKTASEDDLRKLGIVLSQPPFQAPVLAQHTLNYIFSVRPQDRATYFKTLLEVTDLDELRNDIAALAEELKPSVDQLLDKFDTAAAIPILKDVFAATLCNIPNLSTFTVNIENAARVLIENADGKVPEKLFERIAIIEKILTERRSKTFPVGEFERKELAGWNPPLPGIWIQLDTYLDEFKKIDESTRRFVMLFNEALKLPAISGITESITCPLCDTKSALSPERVQIIRQHSEDTKQFKNAETAAKSALSQLSASADALADATKTAIPLYLKMTVAKRHEAGFTVTRIRELLGDRATEFVKPWLLQVKAFIRAATTLQCEAYAVAKLVKEQTVRLSTALDPLELRAAFFRLSEMRASYATEIENYKIPTEALISVLNEVLDMQSDIAGWQNFLDVAHQVNKLHTILIERAARVTVGKELDTALHQIDHAKEMVLDDKFSDYSVMIQAWWERLRPDEPTFFSAVQPRKGAKRTIDFKAGLSLKPDRSAPKMRDVISVFSQSQLHCLGLAMFLARAQHESLGFIILDDPVLSSDEDYRVHFESTVLTELLKIPIQVLVLTQDHNTWKELEIRYRHLGISNAQLLIETLVEGSIIINTSDSLLAKITRAKSLARGGHPDSRKECGIHLRDAGERFCKEMLLNNRIGNGDATASLADYDQKTLEWLCPRVEPLLDHDASHPGKLEIFRKTVNNACHDNTPPSNAEMTQAYGEIRFFVKDYLKR